MIEVVDIGQPGSVKRRRRLPPVATSFGEVPSSVQRRREAASPGTFVQGLSQIPASVQARRRLPGAGTFVSDVDDDQIMLLEDFRAGLGFTPAISPRITPTEPQVIKAPGRFIDGEQVLIGPFMFSAEREGPFSFSCSFDLYNRRPDVRELWNWSFEQVNNVSMKAIEFHGPGCPAGTQWWQTKKLDGKSCLWSYFVGSGNFIPKLSNYPERADPATGGIPVPCGAIWSRKLLNGSDPIAKFKHPKNGQDWGVFLSVDGTGVTWEFKKVEPGFWAKLWGWIKWVGAKLVSFIQDVFRALKAAACQSANIQLEKLAVSAEGKVQLPMEEKMALSAATGLPPQAIDKVASEPTAQLAREIGSKVIAAFCKGDGEEPSPGSTEETEEKKKIRIAPLLLVAGAAGALVWLA